MQNISDTQWQPSNDVHDDDLPVGRILTRRELLALATANAALPTGCVVRPKLTEGPVFVEEELNRSDIRTDPSNRLGRSLIHLIETVSQLEERGIGFRSLQDRSTPLQAVVGWSFRSLAL